MTRTILDCYTDEPAGLGVPPFIGVWPRYAAGWYERDSPRGEGAPPLLPEAERKAKTASPREPTYLTIDDIRLVRYVESVPKVTIDPPAGRTHIEVLNHTRSYEEIKRVLANTDELIIVVGVQTPGKYLSARPGTLHEVTKLLAPIEEAGRRDDPTAYRLPPVVPSARS